MMGSHPSIISRFVVSSWDTRTLGTYSAKICQLSHGPYHGMHRDFRRKSVGGQDRVNWPWGTTQIEWFYAISERPSGTKSWERQTPAAAALTSFAKKDGGLRLCVEFWVLNKATAKNRDPLPLISEILIRKSGIPFTSYESRKVTGTKPRIAPSTESLSTESCHSGCRIHQLPSHNTD